MPAIFGKERFSLSLLCRSKFSLKVENGSRCQHLAPPLLRIAGAPELMKALSFWSSLAPFFLFSGVEIYFFKFWFLDKQTRNRFIDEVQCGGMTVNDCIFHVSNYDMPFGGRGNSGMGSYHGYSGFRAFSHHKSVYQQGSPEFLMSMARPPYTKTKLDLLKMLLKQRPRPRWMPKFKVL